MKILNEEVVEREIVGTIEFRARKCLKVEVEAGKKVNQEIGSLRKCDISKCFYEYPLRLMFPKHANESTTCQWVYPVIFGGGLVEGDSISIEADIGDDCSVLFTSQSFPKVYGSQRGGRCVQKLSFKVGSGSLLAVMSDPVVCYKNSHFVQEQRVTLEKDSNLVYLDWFTAGRTARGEVWDFLSLQTSLSVYAKDELLLREALELSNTPEINVKDTMGIYKVVGVCVVLGPRLMGFSNQLCEQLNNRTNNAGQKPVKNLLFTASPLSKSIGDSDEIVGCVLRIAASTTTDAYRELDRLLRPIQDLFGGNPFENKF